MSANSQGTKQANDLLAWRGSESCPWGQPTPAATETHTSSRRVIKIIRAGQDVDPGVDPVADAPLDLRGRHRLVDISGHE